MAEHCLLRGLLGATVSDVSAKVCHDCKQGNKTKISGKCKIINNKSKFQNSVYVVYFCKGLHSSIAVLQTFISQQ